jgi:hypothetical protein
LCEWQSRPTQSSRLGVCFNFLAGIGFIRHADAALGTDHSRFVARSLRVFEGPMADELGLVRFRVDLPWTRR